MTGEGDTGPEARRAETTSSSRIPKPPGTPPPPRSKWPRPGRPEARGRADSPGFSVVLRAAKQLLRETRSRRPQRPTLGPMCNFALQKAGGGGGVFKIDSNGHTSGQMLPVLPLSQKPGTEGSGGFCPLSWVSAGAEAPNSWSLSLPGSTVGAIRREGGGWVWAKKTRAVQERDPLAHSPE